MYILDVASKFSIKYVVYTKGLFPSSDLKESYPLLTCFECLDARSAAYFACGIAEKNNLPVLLIVNDGGETRSIYSGITEGHYKKLKVITITISQDNILNYEKEIKDCFTYSRSILPDDLKDEFIRIYDFYSEYSEPVHLQIIMQNKTCHLNKKSISRKLEPLLALNSEKNSVFLSWRFRSDKCSTSIHSNIKESGNYGALSNFLGASLANKTKKFIGVFDEKEVLIDLNSLGNRDISDNISIIVVGKTNKIILDYSEALGFICDTYNGQFPDNVTKTGRRLFFLCCEDEECQ